VARLIEQIVVHPDCRAKAGMHRLAHARTARPHARN
jgi:hypothetical protein